MKRIFALAGTLALAFVLSSCGATTGPVGTWGHGYNTDKQPYLALSLGAQQNGDTAGYLQGSDGCNRLSGQWMYASGKLTFPQLGKTQITCEGINGWLSKAASGSVSGNVLTIMDAQGKTIGTLDRRG